MEYQCEGFLEKNKDTVYEEQIRVLKSSKVSIRIFFFSSFAVKSPWIKGHRKLLTNLGNLSPLVSDQLRLNIVCVLLGCLHEFRKSSILTYFHVRSVYLATNLTVCGSLLLLFWGFLSLGFWVGERGFGEGGFFFTKRSYVFCRGFNDFWYTVVA